MKKVHVYSDDVLDRDPPCDQCGHCCLSERCSVSLKLFPAVAAEVVCPALEQIGGKYRCGIVANTAHYADEIGVDWQMSNYRDLAKRFSLLIGIGSGCDYEREYRNNTEC